MSGTHQTSRRRDMVLLAIAPMALGVGMGGWGIQSTLTGTTFPRAPLLGFLVFGGLFALMAAGGAWMLHHALTVCEWTDEWLEVRRAVGRVRVRWNEIVGYRLLDYASYELHAAGGRRVRIYGSLQKGYELLEAALRHHTSALREAKVRNSVAHGSFEASSTFLGIGLGNARWTPSQLVCSGKAGSGTVDFALLARTEVNVLTNYGIPIARHYVFYPRNGKKADYYARIPDSDVIEELIRSSIPDSVELLDFGEGTVNGKVSPEAEARLVAEELRKLEEGFRRVPLVIAGIVGLFSFLVWRAVHARQFAGEPLEKALPRVLRPALPNLVVLAACIGWILFAFLRRRARLRRKAEELRARGIVAPPSPSAQ